MPIDCAAAASSHYATMMPYGAHMAMHARVVERALIGRQVRAAAEETACSAAGLRYRKAEVFFSCTPKACRSGPSAVWSLLRAYHAMPCATRPRPRGPGRFFPAKHMNAEAATRRPAFQHGISTCDDYRGGCRAFIGTSRFRTLPWRAVLLPGLKALPSISAPQPT